MVVFSELRKVVRCVRIEEATIRSLVRSDRCMKTEFKQMCVEFSYYRAKLLMTHGNFRTVVNFTSISVEL